MFAGFLQPTGLTTRLHVIPESKTPVWLGNNAPTPLVRFRIDYGHGQIVVTQTNFGSPPAGAKRDASSIVRMADERPGSWRTFTRPSAVFDRDGIQCSFCGKGYADVEPIVCGPTLSVAICNECVDLCAEIIGEQRKGPTSTT